MEISIAKIFRDAEHVFVSLVEPAEGVTGRVATVDISKAFERVREEFSDESRFEEVIPVPGDIANPYFILDVVTKVGQYHQIRTNGSSTNRLNLDNDLSVYWYTGRNLERFFRSFVKGRGTTTIEEYVEARDRKLKEIGVS